MISGLASLLTFPFHHPGIFGVGFITILVLLVAAGLFFGFGKILDIFRYIAKAFSGLVDFLNTPVGKVCAILGLCVFIALATWDTADDYFTAKCDTERLLNENKSLQEQLRIIREQLELERLTNAELAADNELKKKELEDYEKTLAASPPTACKLRPIDIEFGNSQLRGKPRK